MLPQLHACISLSFASLLSARSAPHEHSTDFEATQRDIKWKKIMWRRGKNERACQKLLEEKRRKRDEVLFNVLSGVRYLSL